MRNNEHVLSTVWGIQMIFESENKLTPFVTDLVAYIELDYAIEHDIAFSFFEKHYQRLIDEYLAIDEDTLDRFYLKEMIWALCHPMRLLYDKGMLSAEQKSRLRELLRYIFSPALRNQKDLTYINFTIYLYLIVCIHENCLDELQSIVEGYADLPLGPTTLIGTVIYMIRDYQSMDVAVEFLNTNINCFPDFSLNAAYILSTYDAKEYLPFIRNYLFPYIQNIPEDTEDQFDLLMTLTNILPVDSEYRIWYRDCMLRLVHLGAIDRQSRYLKAIKKYTTKEEWPKIALQLEDVVLRDYESNDTDDDVSHVCMLYEILEKPEKLLEWLRKDPLIINCGFLQYLLPEHATSVVQMFEEYLHTENALKDFKNDRITFQSLYKVPELKEPIQKFIDRGDLPFDFH